MKIERAALFFFCGMLALSPLGAQDALTRAEQLLAKGNVVAGEDLLRQAIREDPNSWRAHADLGRLLLQLRRTEEALEEDKCAVELAPDKTEVRFGYGVALGTSGRPREAAAQFERVELAEPGRLAPLSALARAYVRAGDPRALEIFQELTALFPENPGLRVQLAEYLWSSGEQLSGNLAMEEAIATAPLNMELHRRFGEELFRQQRFFDAVEELKEARRVMSKSYSVLYLLGNALWQAAKTGEAIEVLEEAVRLQPDKPEAQHDLGKFLAASGEAAKAIPYLEKATQLRGQDVGAWLDLGHAYEAVGKLQDAEASYRRAVTLAPNLSAPRYALGRLLVRQGKRADGQNELTVYRQLYDKAARAIYETDLRHAEFDLATSELNQGNASAALSRFQSLPETADSLIGQAKALSRLNRHTEAVSVLERALLLAPENRKAQSLLAEERNRLGQRR